MEDEHRIAFAVAQADRPVGADHIDTRMLTPRELARPEASRTAAISPPVLTETAQRHKIGNNICPQVAAVLVRDNCIEALTRADLKRPQALRPAPLQRLRPDNDVQADLFGEAA